MTMLPMVTYVMVSQGGTMMAGMVGRVLDGYSKPASSAAMEASAGNFNMGNVSYENQAAFQHNSAPTQTAGFATTNDGRYTNTASQYGTTTKQEQSNLIATPSTSKSMERATAQSVEAAESHVSSTTTNLAKGRDEAIRDSFTTNSGSSVPLLPIILDKALSEITPQQHQKIRQKWLAIHNPPTRELSDIWRLYPCLLYTSPSPRDRTRSRMPSSA